MSDTTQVAQKKNSGFCLFKDVWCAALKEVGNNKNLEHKGSQIERLDSFGNSFKKQRLGQEEYVFQKIESDAPYDKIEEEKVATLLNNLEKVSKKQQLTTFVRLFKQLDPVLTSCHKKLNCLNTKKENFKGAKHLDIESIVSFGRRIRCHVRAPPEYNDPTGSDGFCVPGYFFPCPDRLTMSRSTLFYSDMMRAVPPTIQFEEDSRTRAMYRVVIITTTPKATIFYAINNTSSWNPYNSSQKPYITGPGFYTVRAYCQAEGFLLSEVTLSEMDVPGPEDPHDLKYISELDMTEQMTNNSLKQIETQESNETNTTFAVSKFDLQDLKKENDQGNQIHIISEKLVQQDNTNQSIFDKIPEIENEIVLRSALPHLNAQESATWTNTPIISTVHDDICSVSASRLTSETSFEKKFDPLKTSITTHKNESTETSLKPTSHSTRTSSTVKFGGLFLGSTVISDDEEDDDELDF